MTRHSEAGFPYAAARQSSCCTGYYLFGSAQINTFQEHLELEWLGKDYSSMNVVATYNLIYNATYLVEHGIGSALCLDS